MTILVIGASGFVGRAIVAALREEGRDVRCAVRGETRDLRTPGVDVVPVGDVDASTDWSAALEGVDSVIHLVARTHVIGARGGGDLADYRPVNVDGTRQLAASAANAGVRRLIFMSSVKVNGERTITIPYTADDEPAPEDAYGISKREAEQALAAVAARTGLETVVLRPPLIYGPGVKANFARLARWVERGVPLPLGAIENRRSLVALPNLVDLTLRCLVAPEAAGRTFLVSDGQDISTPELIRQMASAQGVRPRLVPVPVGLLQFAGRLAGRQAEVERLVGSLQVDIRPTAETLGWRPPLSLAEGIRHALGA